MTATCVCLGVQPLRLTGEHPSWWLPTSCIPYPTWWHSQVTRGALPHCHQVKRVVMKRFSSSFGSVVWSEANDVTFNSSGMCARFILLPVGGSERLFGQFVFWVSKGTALCVISVNNLLSNIRLNELLLWGNSSREFTTVHCTVCCWMKFAASYCCQSAVGWKFTASYCCHSPLRKKREFTVSHCHQSPLLKGSLWLGTVVKSPSLRESCQSLLLNWNSQPATIFRVCCWSKVYN